MTLRVDRGSRAEEVGSLEIYVHRPGPERMELREVEETVTVAEATGAGEGEAVWIEDVEETIDLTITVAEAGIPHRGHVHVNRCSAVAVKVTYNGPSKEHPFGPGTTVKAVFEWATSGDGFPLSDVDRAEHTLQLCGTEEQPDPGDHMASFITDDSCEVCFELVAKHRFEG